MKNKKIIIISTIVIASFIIIGLVYAVVTGQIELFTKTKTGTVEIETLNLSFTNEKGESVSALQPGDVSNISYTTKNMGTSGILTRQTIEIYMEDVENENLNEILLLYPANISKEDILADLKNEGQAKYLLETENVTKEVDGKTKYGIKCTFIGDTLDGTSMKGISEEKNYNNSEFASTTDDNEAELDNISLKMLLSPQTSYLYQSKKMSVNITTEALQYTEEESENWVVVDTQQIQ